MFALPLNFLRGLTGLAVFLCFCYFIVYVSRVGAQRAGLGV